MSDPNEQPPDMTYQGQIWPVLPAPFEYVPDPNQPGAYIIEMVTPELILKPEYERRQVKNLRNKNLR
jgi:hypothetical protein